MASEVDVYIHAPYLVNLASTNNRIRIPSRSLLSAHAEGAAAVGAKALIVHGGHVGKDNDAAVGIENWRKAMAYAKESGGFPLPVLVENTAGGDNHHGGIIAPQRQQGVQLDGGFGAPELRPRKERTPAAKSC